MDKPVIGGGDLYVGRLVLENKKNLNLNELCFKLKILNKDQLIKQIKQKGF